MTPEVVRKSYLRALAKEHNRRVGPRFMASFNAFVVEKFIAACKVHNGGKTTLDLAVATYAGCAPKGEQ